MPSRSPRAARFWRSGVPWKCVRSCRLTCDACDAARRSSFPTRVGAHGRRADAHLWGPQPRAGRGRRARRLLPRVGGVANSRHAGEPFGGRLEATTPPLRNHEQRLSPTFSGEFRHSLTEMPEGAPAYKREPNTLRNATRKETWCPFSCHTDTGFSPLPCRLPAHSHVVESRQRAALVTALMRWVRTGIGARYLRTTAGKLARQYRETRPHLIVERPS